MKDPRGYSRRTMLRDSAVGFGQLALCGMLSRAAADESDTGSDALRFLASKQPHFAPRARRLIFLFMKGGPSHVDTFEFKPRLQRDDGKPLPFAKPRVQFAPTNNLLRSPWKFHQYGESGSWVSQLFPHLAGCVDDLCMLHGVHGTNAAHGGALLKLHTGSDNFVRPSMGAWVSYGLGTENENLPAFVTICPTLAHGGVKNWGSAFLPAWCQGTPLGVASQPASSATVKYATNHRFPRRLQRIQLDLLRDVNRQHLHETGPNAILESRIALFELAFRMQTEIPQIQDISDEPSSVRRQYGLDEKITADFGLQCLLARRFAERGVRFIQVTHSDSKVQWDQHSDLKQGHEKNALEVDKPIAGLLADLKARGLLEDTLVLWGGEFGRTPTAQGSNGRDHNPYGFTMWMAGAGVRPGFHYGATDEYGFYARDDKLHIHDVHATLLHILGIDHEQLTYRYAGRDFRLTDVSGSVAHEILS
ncbi:MAG: sulfatase [Planctomycetaceae bacterium]|nr:sulfatase [Planctomycetaceae bacterium]